MAEKTGWLEKWHKAQVVSILEVKYHRVKVKKGPKRKGKASTQTFRDSSLYYVLDKRINLGELTLTGSSVFSKNEIVEVDLPMTKYSTRMRLLGKILKTTSFMELKRVVFRGNVHFAAVNKEDFDLAVSLENKSKTSAPKFQAPTPAPRSNPKDDKYKVTFKRS